MRAIASPLRQTLRNLLRRPLFAVTAILTLGLGIGATSAIFTVVDAVLIEPLPFPEPATLVGVWHTAPGLDFEEVNQSPATYLVYRAEARGFEDIGLWDNRQASVTGLDAPEQVTSVVVTDGLLPLLRVKPALGRLFTREDDSADAPLTVILGHGYWQERFGADAAALGRTLTVNGRAREIVGVLPEGFRLLRYDPALYLPLQLDPAEVQLGNFDYQGIARLRAGVTLEQANAEVARLIPLAAERFPGGITLEMLEQARFDANVRPLKEDAVGDIGSVLWVLLGTVGLVLLVACANVANLFLVRAEGRQRELAVRTALGAERYRLAGQLLLESTVLGWLGGGLGLLLALGATRLLVFLGPETLPRLDEISVDGSVVAFTMVISLLAGLFFGLFPVLRYRRLDLVGSLKEGARGSDTSRQRQRVRSALVIAQMALALVLLVGSGLMIRSFQALRQVNPGFARPAEVLTFRVVVPAAEVEDEIAAAAVTEQILERLAALPGVVSASAAVSITMDGWDGSDAVFVEDFPTPEGQLPPIRRMNFVAPGSFATLENPLLAGRDITWDDLHERRPVAVVTENFAREYWGEPARALGRRLGTTGSPTERQWREIVGVVGNVHDDGLGQDPTPLVYWPMVLENFWGEKIFTQRAMAYAVRTRGRLPESLVPEARAAVWAVNPNLPLADVKTLDEILGQSLARTAFTLVLLGIAAAVALFLGTVGIYGVISYVVSQRTREIGVRMALGARHTDVSMMVLRSGMALVLGGLAIGLAVAVGASRLLAALLYGVRPNDPLTYGGVSLLLAVVALSTAYLAARRAASVDPIEALRAE